MSRTTSTAIKVALGAALFAASAIAPALAQNADNNGNAGTTTTTTIITTHHANPYAGMNSRPYTGPVYNAWQNAWNESAGYDVHHILVGTVQSFSPYRLTVDGPRGVLTIDLKNGTVIRPTGATPTSGDRVAVIGYWSNGTFIANRVVLH